MDQDRKFHNYPRFPRSRNHEPVKQEPSGYKKSQFYSVPMPISKINCLKRSEIESESESESESDTESDTESEAETEVETEMKDISRTSCKLDKWDKGARGWLSSGTMFLLIILFHVIQVRSDLRRFTSAANIQLHEACSVLEDKTMSLQSALDLAAQDVGPISFKFVRDLKSKIRSAFHFAGQIFGGRVREALVSVFKKYYCLLVGALVGLKSLADSILLKIAETFSRDTFIEGVNEIIQKVLDNITSFVTEPDKAFGELFANIMEEVFDATMTSIILPSFETGTLSEVCSTVKTLDFGEIDRLLKGYMAKIISVIAIFLVLYNTFQFIVTIERKPKEDKLKILTAATNVEERTEDLDNLDTDLDLEKYEDAEDEEENAEKEVKCEEPSDCVTNATKWFYGFLSYQPFWIFLSMGVFGVLHIHFSRSLKEKAQHLKVNIIDPAIDQLKDDFVEGLKGYLERMEVGWSTAFQDVIRPITNFLTNLSNLFKPILTKIVDWGSKILKWIKTAIGMIDTVTPENTVSKAITAVLDCFLLKNFRSWIAIAKLINDKLFGGHWSSFKGGIVALLQKSIQSIFTKLQLTKYLKKLLSVHFFMFLKLMSKRSIFLYVYLIVCAILFCQGILMMIIKFLLGYF